MLTAITISAERTMLEAYQLLGAGMFPVCSTWKTKIHFRRIPYERHRSLVPDRIFLNVYLMLISVNLDRILCFWTAWNQKERPKLTASSCSPENGNVVRFLLPSLIIAFFWSFVLVNVAETLEMGVQLAKGVCRNHWDLIRTTWSSDIHGDGGVQGVSWQKSTVPYFIRNPVKDDRKCGKDSISVLLAL